MSNVFQALSSPVRRKILAFLSEASLTAGEIADKFEMSKPALSKHLGILSNAGLIGSEKKGQFVHYYLVKENLFASMNDFLVDFCPEGKPLKIASQNIAQERRDEDERQS
ncbi:winged helix-turn-helix transcriptional regulator [Glaciecola sp. MH2013]|uniref:metalloregulator ArsR/SmtB family transcription factor n=1 Tax=Glaciecola sp. MH2013 TaxID=2785524 RepID=UPI00189D90F9|nr:metalloregulator ArsR/SmtB family transcription factor [Glaciecola sp. MH2013]MBF7072640.1 winged helix-turn-helix transcriptional regulator [Glaciecola sp. MH2013]